MSRVGKAPILIDEKTKAVIGANDITVTNGKNQMKVALGTQVKVAVEGNRIVLTRISEDKKTRALHGLYRALVQNAVTGVSKGFTRVLELHGVGYRANVQGKKLELSLGFSHPIHFEIPEGIEIKVEKQTTISVAGANRAIVGQVAAKIRSFRPPEPYLGKGVRYQGEHIRRKAGKSASK